MVIDGHAHACGEFLRVNNIECKLNEANVDIVLLTPGQYNSKTTYRLKNVAKAAPLDDVVSRSNCITSIVIKLLGAIKAIPKGNECVYQLKCALPERVKQCYWVTKENWTQIQQDYERMQFNAIKFHQCWEKFDIEDDFFVKTVEWSSDKHIPVFIHVCDLYQMKKLILFIKQHQKAIIIIGHLYGLELFLNEEKAYFENTYFDLSNCYFVSEERTMLAYRHFGAKHLIMGSDTPYGKKSLENTIQQIRALKIRSHEKEMILGGNLVKLLMVKD